MYLGHYGVALAAKRASPGTSLGTLILASQLIDILWALLVLVGVERVAVDPGRTIVTSLNFTDYPFTHSLLAVLVWASLFSSLYWFTTRNRTGSLVVWFAVLSHWILDFFTHIPDLPLFPGSEKVVGLGLWNSLWGTLALELGIFFLGLAVYLGTTRPANRIGSYSLLALVTFLLVTYLANIFGPPPPNYRTVAWSGMLLWFLVPWGYWIDRNRHLTMIPGSRSTKLKYKGKKM
jgi:membrane-bound metal-dependent hydrolase YbcI (DUF457 family)